MSTNVAHIEPKVCRQELQWHMWPLMGMSQDLRDISWLAEPQRQCALMVFVEVFDDMVGPFGTWRELRKGRSVCFTEKSFVDGLR